MLSSEQVEGFLTKIPVTVKGRYRWVDGKWHFPAADIWFPMVKSEATRIERILRLSALDYLKADPWMPSRGEVRQAMRLVRAAKSRV